MVVFFIDVRLPDSLVYCKYVCEDIPKSISMHSKRDPNFGCCNLLKKANARILINAVRQRLFKPFLIHRKLKINIWFNLQFCRNLSKHFSESNHHRSKAYTASLVWYRLIVGHFQQLRQCLCSHSRNKNYWHTIIFTKLSRFVCYWTQAVCCCCWGKNWLYAICCTIVEINEAMFDESCKLCLSLWSNSPLRVAQDCRDFNRIWMDIGTVVIPSHQKCVLP